MAVKFPLEVKNGVKARNITELKENFDVEKVVGYFLDGRLKSWLESRYYEEEAEAIEHLDENDGALAKKLCEIFDVKYEMKEIDHEEIARKNERLAKIKQFTADQEVIDNIDCVAFDQEELLELYDMDVKKIYLCEGDFVIPKSKQNLEYCLIGTPNVTGLKENEIIYSNYEMDYEKMLPTSGDLIKEIPLDIADIISHNEFIVLKDYVVLTSKEHKITCINKHTREYFVICEENGTGRVAIKDNIIWYTYRGKNIIHNLDTDKKKIIQTTVGNSVNYSRCKNTILYNNKNNTLQLLDVDTFEITSVFKNGDISQPVKSKHFVLLNEKIYYIPKKRQKDEGIIDPNALYCYNTETKHNNIIRRIMDDEKDSSIEEMVYRDGKFYFICTKEPASRFHFGNLAIIQYSDKIGEKKIFNDGMYGGVLCYSYPYVIYVSELSPCVVNMYNIKTNVSSQLPRVCGEAQEEIFNDNRFSIVGHWLYFDKGLFFMRAGKKMYRVDLDNPVSEFLIG